MNLEKPAHLSSIAESGPQRVQDLFTDPVKRSDAVVVYRRSRRPAVEKAGGEGRDAQQPDDGLTRAPRIFTVPRSDLEEDAGVSSVAQSEAMSGPEPVAKRRRRRDACHAPGKVHHVVFVREVADTRSIEDAVSVVAETQGKQAWHALWQGLQEIDRTLRQIQAAQRFQVQFDRLPFRLRSMRGA